VAAETVWFPVRFSHADWLIPYFTHRSGPFDELYFAFVHIYSYYLLTFCYMTIFHIILYKFVRDSDGFASRIIKWLLYILAMFTAGFLLFFINYLYWHEHQMFGSFINNMTTSFLFYLEMLLKEINPIILYFVVVTITTLLFQQKEQK
jgi:TRAP-type uncharacterized transport system fused permease subunit